MPQSYNSFAQLQAHEPPSSYGISVSVCQSPVLIMAPHGGGIEPGTSELAKAVAGMTHSFYCFEGRKNSGNTVLHLPSDSFDEPQATELVRSAQLVLTLHGCSDRAGKGVYIGGRDEWLKGLVFCELKHAGIAAHRDNTSTTSGRSATNICNRGKTKRGCQLEITEELRRAMFQGWTREERTRTLPLFRVFVSAIILAIAAAGASLQEEHQ